MLLVVIENLIGTEQAASPKELRKISVIGAFV
jgi:hypothetical protein